LLFRHSPYAGLPHSRFAMFHSQLAIRHSPFPIHYSPIAIFKTNLTFLASSLKYQFVHGSLAQLVEQQTLNLLVVGSSPTWPTKRFSLKSEHFPKLTGVRLPIKSLPNDKAKISWKCKTHQSF
jgi:hypothetical protein